MNYDIKTIDKWIAPKEDGVAILTMPNVPLPMHSLAPRTIDPQAWEKMRRQCYADANYTCQATGEELGKGHLHAHELYDIDWTNCTMTFKRAVALDPRLHTRFIHSGRALTLFERNDKYFPKESLIATLEYGFSLIQQWNAEHPDEEPLRVSDTFLEWEKNPDLHYDVARLIEHYDIKFYTFDKKCFNKTNWPKWKLVYNGKEYSPKFATKKEWERHFAPAEKLVEKVEFPNELQDELDKMLGGEGENNDTEKSYVH